MRDAAPIKLMPSVLVAAMVAAMAGCGGEKPKRGLELLPDMFHSPAQKSQSAMAETVGKEAVQVPAMVPPPEGTVPRDHAVPPLSDFAAAHDLVNPQTATPGTLRNGQHQFLITCAACHGNDGDSKNGYVAKYFSGIPAINGANILALSDGDLFHIISRGRNGRMPGFAGQIPADTRWSVVVYLRALSRAHLAVQNQEQFVAKLEAEVRLKPDDKKLAADLSSQRSLLDVWRDDMKRLAEVGEEDASRFEPPRPPVPEYVTPEWQNPSGQAGGH